MSSFIKLKSVMNYLHRFDLKTKKKIAFLRWCKIHDRISRKEHLTLGGLEKITELSCQINYSLEETNPKKGKS